MYKKILSLLLTLYKKPKAVALAGIMITMIFALAIPFIQFDNDIKNFLALDHPHRKANERLDSEFKSSEIIIIGVESDDAFSKETIDYIKWLQGEIDKLNYSFPKENIAHELQISPEEADLVINAINQNELQGIDSLQSLLTNPERMNSELFWDMEFSKKIAKKVKKSSISKLLQLYKLPVAEKNL
jgi:predicted RND superfamily exporter protein